MTKKYQHLFFDLDRTLWDFETNSKLALSELYDKHELATHSTKSFDKFYKTYKSINEFYWRQYRNGDLPKETLRSIRFIRTLDAIGIKNVELGTLMGEEYIQISPYKTALFPNTIATLQYLKDKNYSMHIITNGFKEVQYIKLDQSALSTFFDEIVISEEFGKNKPHPSIFHHALARADAYHHDSLMIGDSIDADLLGAKGINMDQVFFNPEGIDHDHEFTYEIQDLGELMERL